MVGVEGDRPLLDHGVGVCTFCSDDTETAVKS